MLNLKMEVICMIERIKNELFSEKGMKIVNLLFILAVFIHNKVFIICSFIAWLIYLVFSINNTSSKIMKIIYRLLSGYAIIIIVINIWQLLN